MRANHRFGNSDTREEYKRGVTQPVNIVGTNQIDIQLESSTRQGRQRTDSRQNRSDQIPHTFRMGVTDRQASQVSSPTFQNNGASRMAAPERNRDAPVA